MTDFENAFQSLPKSSVIVASRYIPLDLSVSNSDLSDINVKNADTFQKYIETLLSENNAEAAFGGYNEVRNLYDDSAIFNVDESAKRNIHIGIDIWIKARTPILAALDGKIHSFKNNDNVGDYGPTIILEHNINGFHFHTLYGHLSLESMVGIEIGQPIQKGEQIGTLGNASVNGGYAPHLHFQIIKNIAEYFGDYPGVCNSNDLSFYLENCPDPNLLLKIK